MQRGHHDVRRFVVAQLNDEIRQIGLVRRDAGGFERRVELRLIGGHGLDLDDFRLLVALYDADDDSIGFIRVAGPMNFAAGRRAGLFELLEVRVQIAQYLSV